MFIIIDINWIFKIRIDRIWTFWAEDRIYAPLSGLCTFGIFKILCRLLTQDLWTDTFLHTELRSYTNDIIKIDNFVNWHLNLHVVMYKNNNKKQTRCIVFESGWGGGWGWGKTQPINLDNQKRMNQFFICRFEKNVCCKKSAPLTLRCTSLKRYLLFCF